MLESNATLVVLVCQMWARTRANKGGSLGSEVAPGWLKTDHPHLYVHTQGTLKVGDTTTAPCEQGTWVMTCKATGPNTGHSRFAAAPPLWKAQLPRNPDSTPNKARAYSKYTTVAASLTSNHPQHAMPWPQLSIQGRGQTSRSIYTLRTCLSNGFSATTSTFHNGGNIGGNTRVPHSHLGPQLCKARLVLGRVLSGR